MAVRAISIVDLLSFEESREIVRRGDEDALRELLYNIGFDVEYGWDYQICLHTPHIHKGSGKGPVYTMRIVGEERYDEEWLNSEHCSREQRMAHLWLKDRGLVEELERLSHTPNWTGMLIEHLEEYWGTAKDGSRNNE